MNHPESTDFDEALGAVREGNLNRLRELIAAKPDLVGERWLSSPGDYAATDGPSLLHLSTCCDTMNPPDNANEIADLLIRSGADINDRGVMGNLETPLHWAASVGRADLVHLLLDAGADIDPVGGCIANGTPLFLAVCFGNVAAARALIERGAAYNIQIMAALDDFEQVKSFFGPEGNIRDDAGHLPSLPDLDAQEALKLSLWWASSNASLEVVEFLCERGADINYISPLDTTPLDAALEAKRSDNIDFLCKQGAKTRAELPID